MNRKSTLTVLLLVILSVTTVAFAQEEDADSQASMEAWTEAATPGDFHAFFAKKVGSWKIATKMWMQPGAEPMTSEGTAEAKMILGGRFLYETMQGESMGMPFEGLGITGYDNTSKVISSVWYDNMGTVTTLLTGTCEKPGDPMELHGEMFDPMTGMDMKVRTLTTFISHDESLFEYFASAEGMPEMKVMELRYTRIK
jgi:hypothetical protein